MPETPIRGRRGRDRRIAERVASDFAARHAPAPPADEVDFDVAEVDAEVEDARRAATAGRGRRRRSPPSRDARPGTGCPTCRPSRRCWPRPARSPPFASGSEASSEDARRGRHVGLVAVPHGAKSYLAAALALAADGERLVLDRPRRRDRRPRRRGTGRLARRPRCGRRPRAADGPGLRAERAHRRRDGRPGRGARGLARGSRARPGRQRPGAPPAHDRAGRPARRPARAPGRVAAQPGRPAPRAVRPRVRAGQRGRRSRRIRSPGRDRRRLPAVPAAADPDRVLRRRDRHAARVRPDRPAEHRRGRPGGPPAGDRVPAAGRRRGRHPRAPRTERGAPPGAAGRRPRPLRGCAR